MDEFAVADVDAHVVDGVGPAVVEKDKVAGTEVVEGNLCACLALLGCGSREGEIKSTAVYFHDKS